MARVVSHLHTCNTSVRWNSLAPKSMGTMVQLQMRRALNTRCLNEKMYYGATTQPSTSPEQMLARDRLDCVPLSFSNSILQKDMYTCARLGCTSSLGHHRMLSTNVGEPAATADAVKLWADALIQTHPVVVSMPRFWSSSCRIAASCCDSSLKNFA